MMRRVPSAELHQLSHLVLNPAPPVSYGTITPETIKEMAAIAEIAKHVKTQPSRVIALFDRSTRHLRDLPITKAIAIVQRTKPEPVTISSRYLPLLLSSLDLTYSDFTRIQADEQLSSDTQITAETIFLFYRLPALAKFLNVSYAELPTLLSILRQSSGISSLSTPQGVLALLKIWRRLSGDGWTVESLTRLLDKTHYRTTNALSCQT
jgi:hypothetical protein